MFQHNKIGAMTYLYKSLLFLILMTLSGQQLSAEHILHDDIDSSDYMSLTITPQAQRALRSNEGNVNNEIDFAGLYTLRKGDGEFGATRIAWWGLDHETMSGLTTNELSNNAGLLWDINDGDAPKANYFLGTLAIQQLFLDEKVMLQVGKLYPGGILAESTYTGDALDTFFSSLISGDVAGRWFGTIGLGASLTYDIDNWFIQGLVTDAQSDNDFMDFNSLKKGKFLWSMDFSYKPERDSGITILSIVPYTIDALDTLTRENGIVFAFTHEFGEGEEYAMFGRYTFRTGGEGMSVADIAEEKQVKNGGFLGAAWNKPFGYSDQTLSMALMYGKASDYKKEQGFNNQYGTEIFWKFKPTKWLEVTPDLQLVKNNNSQIETIVGLRLKFRLDR